MRYHAVLETNSNGETALAIAHMGDDGPVLDLINERFVAGGEAGIDAMYRGMRERGFDVKDCRVPGQVRTGDVRARAIASALELAGAH